MDYPIYKIKSLSRKSLYKLTKRTSIHTKDKLSVQFALRMLDELTAYNCI